MEKKIVIAAFLVISNISLTVANDIPETITVQMLAGEMAAHKPQICLGFEHLAGINNTISGKDAIKKAMEGWEAFSKIVSNQTGYEAEIKNTNILVRPKVAPDKYVAPIVIQLVQLSKDPVAWKTLGEAVKSISFVDSSRTFNPLVSFEFADADQRETKFGPALLPEVKALVETSASRKIALSDALFILARSIGAKQWNYAPYDVAPDGQKPQKLAFATLTFAGKLDEE